MVKCNVFILTMCLKFIRLSSYFLFLKIVKFFEIIAFALRPSNFKVSFRWENMVHWCIIVSDAIIFSQYSIIFLMLLTHGIIVFNLLNLCNNWNKCIQSNIFIHIALTCIESEFGIKGKNHIHKIIFALNQN